MFQCLDKNDDAVLAVDDEGNVFDITQDMVDVSVVQRVCPVFLSDVLDATMAS